MKMLEGKVAIVTGGASGVGVGSARTLARHGAAVLVADLNGDGAAQIAEEIRGAGGRSVGVEVDVTDEAQVAAMVATALGELGGLDVLHNNAALTAHDVLARDGEIAEADAELWRRTLDVNVIGYVLCAKRALPAMVERGSGVIVNTTSGTAFQSERTRPAYGTSKAAIVGLTRNIATQYGSRGIRCVALALGLVGTPALKANIPPAVTARFLRHQLVPRLAEPEDVGEVVAFVASDRAAMITGTTLAVDGGFSTHTPNYADEA